MTAAKGDDFSQNGGGPTHTMEQQTNNFHSQTSQELGMLSPSLFIQESQCNCYRTQVYLGSDPWVRVSLTPRGCADLTDVTLVDKNMQVMNVMQVMQVMQVIESVQRR